MATVNAVASPYAIKKQIALRPANAHQTKTSGIAVAVRAIGYHLFEGLGWLDAILNAALVMTGNGPIDRPSTREGKLFRSVP